MQTNEIKDLHAQPPTALSVFADSADWAMREPANEKGAKRRVGESRHPKP